MTPNLLFGSLSIICKVMQDVLWSRQSWINFAKGFTAAAPSSYLKPIMTSSSLTIRDIERHKAATARNDLSKPVRLALEANLFNPSTTISITAADSAAM
jgi:hypothetical protein